MTHLCAARPPIPSYGQMAVYHHPCGKREALPPHLPKPECPECCALFAAVEKKWSDDRG